jgi:hypothetical protein
MKHGVEYETLRGEDLEALMKEANAKAKKGWTIHSFAATAIPTGEPGRTRFFVLLQTETFATE